VTLEQILDCLVSAIRNPRASRAVFHIFKQILEGQTHDEFFTVHCEAALATLAAFLAQAGEVQLDERLAFLQVKTHPNKILISFTNLPL
jgi:hypothetical protein